MIQGITKKVFSNELNNFEKLLNTAMNLSKQFPILIKNYMISNAHGTLHFLFSRNIRLIQQSYKLVKEGYYTEAIIIIRSVMEGALLARYFAKNPLKLKEWHESQEEISRELDPKTKWDLRRKRESKYGPETIRKEIAAGNEKLQKDIRDVYSALSDFTHPSILKEGDFLKGRPGNYSIVIEPYFHKGLFLDWFKAASLALSTNMKVIEIYWKNKVFEHLGKSFIFEIDEMAKQILELMNCLPKDQ